MTTIKQYKDASTRYHKISAELDRLSTKVGEGQEIHLAVLSQLFTDLGDIHVEAADGIEEALRSRRGYRPDMDSEAAGDDGPNGTLVSPSRRVGDNGPITRVLKGAWLSDAPLSADGLGGGSYPTGLED